ncbi:MAG: Peptidase protein, partial [Patescibacteria group bacterium]|nr:Peptidase protein [Patescibacteria group bacterium]
STSQLSNALFIKPQLTYSQYNTSLMDALVVSGAVRARGFVVDYAADLAETFPSENNIDIKPGTLVSFSTSTVSWNIKTGTNINSSSDNRDTYTISTVKVANKGEDVIGVISSNPGLLLGGKNGVPVAFQGRVPVLVDNVNGTIKKGDNLTLSTTTAGYATKVTTDEADTVGIAMSDDNGSGKVLMLVQNGYKKLDLSKASTTASLFGNTEFINLNNLALTNIKSISSSNGSWSINEEGRIEAKQICLDNDVKRVCVDADQLERLGGSNVTVTHKDTNSNASGSDVSGSGTNVDNSNMNNSSSTEDLTENVGTDNANVDQATPTEEVITEEENATSSPVEDSTNTISSTTLSFEESDETSSSTELTN